MKNRYNFKQRYKTIQGLRSFKDTLPTKARKIISKKGEVYSKTLDNWKYLVGDQLFKVCYPKSFKKSNLKGKCLNIMVKHGHEVDLEYYRKLIIDKINYFFGYEVVNNIILNTFEGIYLNKEQKKVTNVTKNRYTKKISDIKNNTVKDSLFKLTKVYRER